MNYKTFFYHALLCDFYHCLYFMSRWKYFQYSIWLNIRVKSLFYIYTHTHSHTISNTQCNYIHCIEQTSLKEVVSSAKLSPFRCVVSIVGTSSVRANVTRIYNVSPITKFHIRFLYDLGFLSRTLSCLWKRNKRNLNEDWHDSVVIVILPSQSCVENNLVKYLWVIVLPVIASR